MGPLVFSGGFINMRSVACLGKSCDKGWGQSENDQRMFATVISGKSIGKCALHCRQCGEEGFVPDFTQRYGAGGAPVTSLMHCPYGSAMRKLQNKCLSLPRNSKASQTTCKSYSPVTSESLGSVCIPQTTVPTPVAGWATPLTEGD